MNLAETSIWIARRTLWWVLGTLLVGGLLELLLRNPSGYRLEVPLVLAGSVGVLVVSGSLFALALVRLLGKR